MPNAFINSLINPVPAFAAEFSEKAGTKLDIWSKKNPTGRFKTDYYFGNQRHIIQRDLTREEQLTSRTLSNELQLYGDAEYTPNWDPFWVGNGGLNISALRLPTPEIRKAVTLDRRDYVSGLISTQLSHTQIYGYWEMRIFFPLASGTWPAGWLLPKDKTATNLGRLPEIDIFEHYSGPNKFRQSMPGVQQDRTGLIMQTVHLGVAGSERAVTNPKPPKIDVKLFHVYGLLWTKSELIWYIDGVETWRLPFSYDQPMYLILDLAISELMAGDPTLSDYKSKNTMIIDYIRIHELAG